MAHSAFGGRIGPWLPKTAQKGSRMSSSSSIIRSTTTLDLAPASLAGSVVAGAQTTFTITDGTDLFNAIDDIDAAAVPGATYTFVLAPSAANAIVIDQPLDAIALAGGASLAIDGNGATLDVTQASGGLVVAAGSVSLADVTLAGPATTSSLTVTAGATADLAEVTGLGGSIVVQGARATLALAPGETIGAATTLDLADGATLAPAGGTFTGPIVESGDPTYSVAPGTLETVSSAITGSGNVVVDGGGTVEFTSIGNTYSGGTTITQGSTLIVATTTSPNGNPYDLTDAGFVQFGTSASASIALNPGPDGVADFQNVPFANRSTVSIAAPFYWVEDSSGDTEVIPQTLSVSDATGLSAAIYDIDLATQAGSIAASGGSSAAPQFTIDIRSNIDLAQLGGDLKAFNLAGGASVTVNGNGHTLDGEQTYMGLFAYAGAVNVNDLTIANTRAIGGKGGIAPVAGGGGAGLGGGLFVAAGADVTLTDVTFTGDSATGGAGGKGGLTPGGRTYNSTHGGGGGLDGGNGGDGGPPRGFFAGSEGGGGGVGLGANGGSAPGGVGGAGIIPGAPAGQGDVTPSFQIEQTGGASAGGGGAGAFSGNGGASDNNPTASSAGFGGGAGSSAGTVGGLGGGGAGGVGHYVNSSTLVSDGGQGGFGGGGGGGSTGSGGTGGGPGGFGGGNGSAGFLIFTNGTRGGVTGGSGGGGLGAGGDIFVEQGGTLSIEAGSLGAAVVQGGAGGGPGPKIDPSNKPQAGSAYGSGIFIEGNQGIELGAPPGQTLTIAGTIADQDGSVANSGGTGAVTIDGGGAVLFTAANTYTGGTTITQGSTLVVSAITGNDGNPYYMQDAGFLELTTAVTSFSLSTDAEDGPQDLQGLPFAEHSEFSYGSHFYWVEDSVGGTELIPQTMTVSDSFGMTSAIREIDLAAQSANILAGPNTPSSPSFTIDISPNSDVDLTAINTVATEIVLNVGATLEIAPNASAGSGSVAFVGNGDLLRLDAISGTIASTGSVTAVTEFAQLLDTIDLRNVPTGDVSVTSRDNSATVTIAGAYSFDVSGDFTHLTPESDGSGGTLIVACYVEGTRIATPDGEWRIETLSRGDHVRLARGGSAEVVWLGRRRFDTAVHSEPHRVMPLRVRAHAFAPNRPHDDLLLSPDHAVFVEGVLIPIGRLENSTTIVREDAASLTYWHIELAAHEIILAEGLPAESWLDTGNRAMFDNAQADIGAAVVDPRRIWTERGCAPLVETGPILSVVRERLAARAALLGWKGPASLEIKVEALGCITVAIPANASRARVLSPSGYAQNDRRRLGALLRAVQIDDVPLSPQHYGRGFHAAELHGSALVRWTDGDAVLEFDPASKARVLKLDVQSLLP